MSVEDTIKDCINYLNEDVCNKSFLTYEEEREWEDYITRLINNSNKEKDKEIERLNNIINKAIEYIEEQTVDVEMNIYGMPPTIKSFRGNTERLLEILDKGE